MNGKIIHVIIMFITQSKCIPYVVALLSGDLGDDLGTVVTCP